MTFFRFVMITIEMVCAFLLVGVILLQRTKSQGLGGLAFGQSMGESMFGSRAGNVLTKATIILGSIFLANTLFLGMTYANARSVASQAKSVMERQGLIPMAAQSGRAMPASSALPGLPPAPKTVPAASAPASVPAPVAPATPAPATK